jgi:signal transduction histidine kinase
VAPLPKRAAAGFRLQSSRNGYHDRQEVAVNWSAVARWRWELALAACISVSAGILIVAESGHSRLTAGYNDALESMWLTTRLNELLTQLVDAETAQRGYLLLRQTEYLKPYEESVPKIKETLADLRVYYSRARNPQQVNALGTVSELAGAKIGELEQTLSLARQGRTVAAMQLVASGGGRERMEAIRERIAGLQRAERERTSELVNDWRSSLQLWRFGIAAITALNIVLLIMIVRWLKQDWLRSRERERLLDRLVGERTIQLATLSAHLQEVSETEKTRLARDLHDELGSILTASKMDVSWVRGKLGPEQAVLAEKLGRAMKHLDQGIQTKRRIIENLRPTTLATFGLTTATRELVEQTAEQAGWALDADLPDSDPDLPEDVEIALFRIVQEALNNAVKYSKATRVRVSLRCERAACTLEIEDNGVGFSPGDMRDNSHGLTGMRQRLHARGGRLDVVSERGRGTRIHASVNVKELGTGECPFDPANAAAPHIPAA